MKIVNILALFVLSMMLFQSCDKSEAVVTGKEGGLVEVKNPSINYVVGNPGPYTAAVRVYQGAVKTTKVEVYKFFNTVRIDTFQNVNNEDSIVTTAVKSNEVLFHTFDLTGETDQNSIHSFDFTFSDLRADLTIDGNELPTLDGDYRIGDNWEFYYMATSSNGVAEQNTPTKVTVATRYAGKYRLAQGVYYRIHVLTDQGSYWPAETLFESIDAKTYKMNGVAAWPANVVYFQIDGAGKITYPATWDGVAQTINAMPLITCESNAADMTEVCGLPNANTVINDDVKGMDHLVMSFGYMTGSGAVGPRVFYQDMEKIVE